MIWINGVLLVTLTLAAYTDFKDRKVSNRLVLAAFLLILPVVGINKNFPEALFPAILPIGLVLFLYFKECISGGDAKLLLLLALNLPPARFFILLLVMFLVGIIQGMRSWSIHKKFGPEPLVPGILFGFILVLLITIKNPDFLL